MQIDNSFHALFVPGDGKTYFDALASVPFQPDAEGYSAINAWWLAELSRLIYRHGPDEVKNPVLPQRKEILAGVGLSEQLFFKGPSTQGALVGAEAFDVLVFRGTEDVKDWVTNLNSIPVAWEHGGRVHAGFKAALAEVWTAIAEAVHGSAKPLFVTGHSLGAALATLAASKLAHAGRTPRALYTFGSPRVGDSGFAHSLAEVPVFRVVNNRDLVPTVPPPILGYTHVGELRYIESSGELAVNPRLSVIAEDQLHRDPTYVFSTDTPPERLVDHAPVNYVAWLERFAKS